MKLATLMLVDGLGLSGKTKALCDLALGLDKQRFDPIVVCFARENSPLADGLEHAGIPVIEVPIKERLRPGNLRELQRIIKVHRPDIVHCYNPRAMLYGGLAARLLGVRATLGSLSAFACMVPDRHYDFLPQRLLTRTFSNRIRNRFVAALMQKLAVVSLDLGERFCRFNKIAIGKLRLVPYGVAVDPESDPGSDLESRARERSILRSQWGIADADLLIGSVGRLVEQKDYVTQIEGFALAARGAPSLKMVLIGEGPLRGELEAAVARLRISSKVTFLGYRSDVQKILRSIDIFAMTSKFEPYGVALLEAKANGVPIIAAAVNQVPEILSSGASGLLFQAGSIAGFADAILQLAGDRALRDRMSSQAYREACTRHSLSAMIEEYEKLYLEVYGLGLG